MASSSTADKSTRDEPRSPKRSGGEWVEYDQFIDLQIRKTRGQVKGVEIASALMTLAAGALAFFLVAAVLDQWVLPHGFGFWGRLLCLAIFLGGAGYYAADKLLPWLIHRINPIYAAQAIERSRPTLKNSLINFLFLRGQTAHMPPAVYKAVEEQAAAGLSRVTVESAVDRTRLIHIGYALLAVVVLFAAYFLRSPKSPWDTIGRIMLPWSNIPVPTRVEILEVQPGTQTVFRGEPVEVSAEIRGLDDDEPVRVVYSTADQQTVDRSVPMYLPPDRFRHSAKIPTADANGQQSADGQSAGVQQDIDYRIEAGDAVSPKYHLTAVTAPTILLESVDYQFPSYTGRAPISLKGIGDIQSLEGTRVVIHGRANQQVKSAQLELEGREGGKNVPMRIGDDGRTITGSFTLALDEQDRTSPQFSHYRLRPEERAEPQPVQYRIDVIPDLPPEVKFILPEKDEVTLPVNRRLKLKLRALDPDFALSEVTLAADSNRNRVLDERLLGEIRREPMQKDIVIDPAKLHLKAGDLVEYWATAKDNRAPTPNSATTTRRRIRIVAADARQGDASKNNGDGSNEGNPADESNNSNPSNKSNDSKKPPADGPKQDQQPQEKQANDKSQPGKPSKEKQADNKSDGSKSDGAENQPPDAAHDQKQEKSSADQKQQDGNAKQQDSSKNKSGNNQDSSKQDSDNQNSGKSKSEEQQKGDGSSKAGENGGQKSQKSDSSKGGSDNKSGGDSSNAGKSGKSKNSSDSQNGNNQSGDKPNGDQKQNGQQQNAKPAGQQNERLASDSSDDDAALQRTVQHNEQEQAKNGSQKSGQKPSDQSQNSADQKQSTGDKHSDGKQSGDKKSGQKQPGGNRTDSKNAPESQPKPGDEINAPNPQQKAGGDSSKSAGDKKPTDDKKPADGQKTGDNSAGDKKPGGKSAGAKPKPDKPNGDQSSTKEGDATESGAKKDGSSPAPSDKSNADKSNGANSTKEQAPTDKPASDKASGSKSGDKAGKPDAKKPRDSDPGQNKTGKGDKPDNGSGERTSDGSQPTGDKHEAQPDKEKSNSKSGDPDSHKGESGAGSDTAKDGHDTPPAPQEANQPTKNKKPQPKSAGKKEMKSKDSGKSPSVSPKESTAQGGQDGSQSGGGKEGGGQGANQAGTGGAGKNAAANEGNGVAQGHGQGEDSKKAGTDRKANDRTGQKGTEKGAGSHTRAANSDNPNSPNSDQSQEASKPTAKSPQGSPSKKSDSPTGPGGASYVPHGGSGNSGNPTGPPPAPEASSADAANAEFAKKQFDMALESLKKGKPDLLKELNWTPEEARKLADRLEQMRRNAEVPGPKGDDARRRMDEMLHSLGSRSGRVDRRKGSNATDTQRGLHESHDAGPPPEYSEQFQAFQQGILQGGK